MIFTGDAARHLDDGKLIRLLDGEAAPDEEEVGRAHLRSCETCRAAANDLADLSDRFGRLVALLDEPAVAENRGRRRWLWGTGGAVLLLAVLAVVSPVRAWAVGLWRALLGERPPAAVVASSPAVTVIPTSRNFTVRFASRQAGGTLTLSVTPDSALTTRVIGSDGSEELVVGADGIDVINGVVAAASYEILIPAGVDTVLLTIGSEAVNRLVPKAGWQWHVHLAAVER